MAVTLELKDIRTLIQLLYQYEAYELPLHDQYNFHIFMYSHFRHPTVFVEAWMQHDEGNLKNDHWFLKKDSAPLDRLCNTPVS